MLIQRCRILGNNIDGINMLAVKGVGYAQDMMLYVLCLQDWEGGREGQGDVMIEKGESEGEGGTGRCDDREGDRKSVV